ncbi:MAG TPA: HAMP domain-containing sensor histidine kinase [Bacteroidales bacterium]|jgi:two-component system phosphate regulon sensor histidine kinase PhoR|nr:HAMP domain-containing sensor histidine kinase [Bacteroidales bacterium]
MSKKRFIILITMMVLSLTGIIWVQIIWIRKAVSIRNENFNRAVFSGLEEAANTIESNRKMSFFFDNPGITRIQPEGDVSGYLSIGSYSSTDGRSYNYSITSQTFSGKLDSAGNVILDKPVITRKDTTITNETGIPVFPSSGPAPEIRNGETLNDAESHQGQFQVDRNELIEWIRRRAYQFQNMSDQMITEVYQWEKTMDLKKEEVNFALQRSFMFSGIETPYEFAVIKDGKVQEGSFKKSNKNDFLKSHYMVQLFPDNIMHQNLIVSVIFPERTNYVLGSMTWLLGGSLVFSLVILATFGLSLFFIIRQKKISEMKSDFINNMTHEFKTPIATISLAADTITNPKVINDETSIRHFIGMIKKENERMNKKVETILQIASLDKKEIEFRFENVSLHSIIERAVETIEIQVHQKNGKITLKLDAHEPVIYGDSDHLLNLVNNLLDNSIKYSAGAPAITVETRNNDNGIILSVQDKGIGMSKSVQSRIFERFYRQTSGDVHDVKGFGLGLNYARAIIDAHKGNVTVVSEPGKGSRFDVFLPFNWENQ